MAMGVVLADALGVVLCVVDVAIDDGRGGVRQSALADSYPSLFVSQAAESAPPMLRRDDDDLLALLPPPDALIRLRILLNFLVTTPLIIFFPLPDVVAVAVVVAVNVGVPPPPPPASCARSGDDNALGNLISIVGVMMGDSGGCIIVIPRGDDRMLAAARSTILLLPPFSEWWRSMAM